MRGWISGMRVLRFRDVRFVFGASLVSQLGDGVVGVALAFAVLDLTGSPTDLGLVLAVRTVAQVVALLIGGVVADRVSRRAVMMAADLVRFFGQAAIGVMLATHDATLLGVVLSQVVLGAASGFFNPAASGLLPAVAGEYLQEANALQGVAMAAAGIIGPAIGGILVVGIGSSWGLVADSLSYAGSALLLARLSPEGVAAATSGGGSSSSFLRDLRGGLREVTSRTWVWAIIIGFGVSNSLSGTWEVFGPLVSRRSYGGAGAFALLTAMWSVGAVLGGLVLLRWKPRHPLRAGVLICMPMTASSVLAAVGAPLVVVVPFAIIAGLAPIMFNTLYWTTLQTRVPPEAISRVISYDYAGSFALQPIGYALAGPLVVWVGLTAGMLGCAIGSLCVVASMLLVRDVRVLEAGPPAGAQAADEVMVEG
jgi:MFS family permease